MTNENYKCECFFARHCDSYSLNADLCTSASESERLKNCRIYSEKGIDDDLDYWQKRGQLYRP